MGRNVVQSERVNRVESRERLLVFHNEVQVSAWHVHVLVKGWRPESHPQQLSEWKSQGLMIECELP